ncbi:MAG: alpha/beta hydrolase [Deltaproteobacteria bacterium]|nr:alpha/beta hydrolase [Deltaproteobacteria bacterium]
MKKKKRLITILALVVVLPLIVIYGIGYFAAHKALHLPHQPILKTPAEYGLKYENISFKSTDKIPLKGWWIPGDSSAVIFIIHGYGANRAGWLGKNVKGEEEYIDWLASAPPLIKAGFNLVYFDLRASGESGGNMITLGKYETNDLMGAINWVLDNKKQSNGKKHSGIGLIGMSMGGNVSLRGAIEIKKLPIEKAAVISVGAYRFDTMIDKSIRFWTSLPGFFIPIVKQMVGFILGFNPSVEIDPSRYVGEISPIPVMFIQAEKDEIGDVKDVEAIYRSTAEPKELIILPDAPRFKAYKYPAENPEKIVSFFSKYLL